MTDGDLGRLLPACLHQAIADEMPQRLDFYEEWLHPDRLRDGTIGLAPLSAVLGFLRTEGAGYEAVVRRAGTLAAEWSIASLPPYRRRLGSMLPLGMRCRYALRIAKEIVGSLLSTSKAAAKVRRGRATLRVEASVFCSVREQATTPLCGFYRALVAETLRTFQITAATKIESCHAVSSGSCVLSIDLQDRDQLVEPARAA